MAMLLADLLRRNDLRSPASLQFRLLAPVFEGTPIRLRGRVDSDFVLLEAQASDGARVVEAQAAFQACGQSGSLPGASSRD
jgi:hydroxyacyl-ACP dehydratase HTD2-like protein with hotdog domain